MRLEEGIISLLNKSSHFVATTDWIGSNSPVKEIATSGLWNRLGLEATPPDGSELDYIRRLTMFGSSDSSTLKKISPQTQKNPAKKVKSNQAEGVRKISTRDAELYVKGLVEAARNENKKYIDLVSSEIHKALGMSKRMPQVCSAMHKVKADEDERFQ